MSKKIDQKNLAQLSDERLVALASKNNQTALEVLVSRYLKIIYNFVYRAVSSREEAEDLTQEVFVKLWKNLDKFDANKTFKPWLYKIAKNTYLDYYKKQQPSPFSALAESNLIKIQPLNQAWSLASESQESLMDKDLLQAKFNLAVASLEASSAEIVTMHHERDLSFKTIAQIKQQPLNTVKSKYHRALSKIRKNII
jgi:RNA polymerase sigma-70 factor (ECF subfamily)